MSPDIEKGTRWSSEIANQLEKSKVGVVCITRENLDNRWILFESGALSKTRDARPCTFLLDVTPAEVEQPLAQFQHTQLNKKDIWKLLITIKRKIEDEGEKAPSEGILSNSFEAFWPRFEKDLQKIAEKKLDTKNPARNQNDIFLEILELTRNQNKQIEQLTQVRREFQENELPIGTEDVKQLQKKLNEKEERILVLDRKLDEIVTAEIMKFLKKYCEKNKTNVGMVIEKISHTFDESTIIRGLDILERDGYIECPEGFHPKAPVYLM
jgi:hypothetical protein